MKSLSVTIQLKAFEFFLNFFLMNFLMVFYYGDARCAAQGAQKRLYLWIKSILTREHDHSRKHY